MKSISVKGARQHNLKGIDLEIPKDKLVVFTGISGSGKSSLAFDTLYAEGQRRYVESLSSYARQFLGVMNKPDVDHIEGLSPAISIDQKTTSHNPRSTVGTITEIYDYLRLLFARVGHPHCPNCGREISTQSVDQIIGHILSDLNERTVTKPQRFMILAPVVRSRKGEFAALFSNLQKKGYERLRVDKEFISVHDDIELIKTNKHSVHVVLDRLSIDRKQLQDEKSLKTLKGRLNQSVEESLKLSNGFITVSYIDDQSLQFPDNPSDYEDRLFSENLACSHCGISISELEPRLFSFNSPQGACETCNGLGSILKIDPEKILAESLTVSEGAIVPFARTMSTDSWWARLVREVIEDRGFDFRKTPFEQMDKETQDILLHGSDKVYEVHGVNRHGRETVIHEQFEGFQKNLERRYEQTDSDYIRKEIEQYMLRQACHSCNGTRLKPEALNVHIDGKNIAEISNLAIRKTLAWVEDLQNEKKLNPKEALIAKSILKEIVSRLSFLNAVGLNYLSLDREAGTLAGGEAQRIRLASQIGTGLTGVLYILDEPTIGLHQRDNDRLIATLKQLRDRDNTVIVVEHDRDLMLAADHIIDFGPLAGNKGGEVVSSGDPAKIMADSQSLTGKYLKRKKEVTLEEKIPARLVIDPEQISKEQVSGEIRIEGASEHNLQTVDVSFPLSKFVCITGVSGSGKSTLLHDTLYYNLAKHLKRKIDRSPGEIKRLTVPDAVRKINLIDQSPIGKTPRSNPATYTKLFDHIRKIYANTRDAQMRGFGQGRFSFNVKGGRCEACQGDGQLKIEMQFLPDVYVTCDVCHGQRYNAETLEVRYKEKTISDVLQMSVDEAFEFFSAHSTLRKKLKTLQAVGLGYVKLGQAAPTLSGGEAQRVKLARELSTRYYEHTVYLLDEPTTGLHFHDVQKLLHVLSQLVKKNNTVIVIEHNLDVIKNADHIIDLGPEGGEFGGTIIAEGSPIELSQNEASFTGQYLKKEFAAMAAQ